MSGHRSLLRPSDPLPRIRRRREIRMPITVITTSNPATIDQNQSLSLIRHRKLTTIPANGDSMSTSIPA